MGSHDFDRGAEDLFRLQHGGCKTSGGTRDANSCTGAAVGTPVPFEGARFQCLAANVISGATGRRLLPSHGVKTFDGIDVAFVGMTLRSTGDLVSPAGIEGLEFGTKPKR